MKICIYSSESQSWIYFYIFLNKNWKNYWFQQSFIGLGPRTSAHRKDCLYISDIHKAWEFKSSGQRPYTILKQTDKKYPKSILVYTYKNNHHIMWHLYNCVQVQYSSINIGVYIYIYIYCVLGECLFCAPHEPILNTLKYIALHHSNTLVRIYVPICVKY